MCPPGWQGGLPLPYHVGPGPAEVRFSVAMDYQIRKIWNVIATIPGTVEPDRWVMIGNHRDAWVYGAVDPGSGTAATMEMCRALGAAVKNGWKPRRTLLYASWDAEEYGLVGSTEWAEQNSSSINEKAVLLLNVDSAVSGPEFGASGVPSLRELVLDAAGSDRRSANRASRSASAWTDAHRATWAASCAARSDRSALGRRPSRAMPIASHAGPRLVASFPNWARSDPALTTPRFSTIWPCRPSTWAFTGDMGSITRSTTTSTGWRNSATPNS